MGQITHNDTTVLEQIQEKIKKAPHNWAEMIADRMGKNVISVYAYANGTRGLRRGYPVEVLKHLNELIEEKNSEIEKVLQK